MFRTVGAFAIYFSLIASSSSANGQEKPPMAPFRLVSVELAMDGSVKPPGDELAVLVMLGKTGQPARLEIKAIVASGDNNEILKPVQSAKGKHQGAEGEYLLRVPLSADDWTPIERRITVPYSDLHLPIGKHRLGYQVFGYIGATQVFASATPLTLVEITEMPRRGRFERRYRASKTVDQVQTAYAVVRKHGQIVLSKTEEVVKKPVFEERVVVVETDITGGYHRTEIDAGPPAIDEPREPGEWIARSKLPIYYSTNRAIRDPAARDARRFSDKVDVLTHYGSVLVNIPVEQHVQGELERPRWWQPWQRLDPEKHFLLEGLNEFSEAQFFAIMAATVAERKEDVLVFVHGYNNSFEDAALRFAQIAHDIRFVGTPLPFSWPSQGRFEDYAADEREAMASIDALADVLAGLVARRLQASPGNGRIHLLAHSLGGRVLLHAIQKARSRFRRDKGLFAHVILAAPDIDVLSLNSLWDNVKDSADVLVLYYCGGDRALRASEFVHRDQRVGKWPAFLDPMQNINSNKADTSGFSLRHGHIAMRPLLVDMDLTINFHLDPNRRPTLRKLFNKENMKIYWEIR